MAYFTRLLLAFSYAVIGGLLLFVCATGDTHELPPRVLVAISTLSVVLLAIAAVLFVTLKPILSTPLGKLRLFTFDRQSIPPEEARSELEKLRKKRKAYLLLFLLGFAALLLAGIIRETSYRDVTHLVAYVSLAFYLAFVQTFLECARTTGYTPRAVFAVFVLLILPIPPIPLITVICLDVFQIRKLIKTAEHKGPLESVCP